ncbi:MAG: IclR family transcriptional regulator [Blastomonas sp.]
MGEGDSRKMPRKGIQSVEIGFDILAAMMQARRPLPLKDISKLTGLPSSKLHSYLVSLVSRDVVIQHSDTGRYGLGPLALKLGLAVLDQFDLFTATRPVMRSLAEEIGHTVFLGVWGNRGPTIIHRVDGPLSQIVLDLRVGSVLPVLRSAVGRNLAAYVPESLVRPLITPEMEAARGSNSGPDSLEHPQTYAMAERVFEEARQHGIARARGGLMSDFTALSVPIFDFSGHVYGALTIMGRTNVFDDSLDGEPAHQLKAACREISEAGGWREEAG